MNKPVFLHLEKVQIQMMAAGIGQALPPPPPVLHIDKRLPFPTRFWHSSQKFRITYYKPLKKKHTNVIWKQKETIAWIKDQNWVKVDFPMAGP